MDPRRVGHAQRRRNGFASNVYAQTMRQPSHDVGDIVKAQGRYREAVIEAVVPNVMPAGPMHDGHAYVVRGGKTGRLSVHLSGELRPFEMGTSEAT